MKKTEVDKKIAEIAYMHFMSEIEATEYYYLLEELRAKNLKGASALYNYVVKNDLTNKYPHITGMAGLGNNESTWDIEGGFSTLMYGRIKSALSITGPNTSTHLITFKPNQNFL